MSTKLSTQTEVALTQIDHIASIIAIHLSDEVCGVVRDACSRKVVTIEVLLLLMSDAQVFIGSNNA